MANIRKLLEDWFAIYPESEKLDLKRRFKAAFDHAFFELYIFGLFTNLGYTLNVHPEILGTAKRPDFLAEKGATRAYIEVKHIMMKSQKEQALERKKNALLDSIDKVDASNFLIVLREIVFKSDVQPSGRNVIRFLNKVISQLDPDIYGQQLLENGPNGSQKIVYEDNDVKIGLWLMPKVPSRRGTNSRSIGAHPSVTQIGNDSESIREALENKATRYGILNTPYIICLNKQGVGLDKLEIQEALYGDLRYSWSENPISEDGKLELSGNGFFGSKTNPKFTRVSGVYVTNANTANLTHTADHVFRHNPFATFKLDLSIKQPIAETFKISPGYPYNA